LYRMNFYRTINICFLYFAIFVMRVAERFPLQKKELDLYDIVELI